MYKIDVRKKLPHPKIPKRDQENILKKIKALAEDPRPRWAEKLTGKESYRISMGDYRILYTIDDEKHQVFVHDIGHRKGIYRD